MEFPLAGLPYNRLWNGWHDDITDNDRLPRLALPLPRGCHQNGRYIGRRRAVSGIVVSIRGRVRRTRRGLLAGQARLEQREELLRPWTARGCGIPKRRYRQFGPTLEICAGGLHQRGILKIRGE